MRAFSKRVGVLGDVHCEDQIVTAALKLYRRLEVEAVLCVGDVVDGHGDVARTIELLRQHGVETVRGNHERWCLSDTMRELPGFTLPASLRPDLKAWLADLPLAREYETPLGRLLLCHGMGPDDMGALGADEVGYALANNEPVQQVLREKKYQVVLSGHSHKRVVRRLKDVLFLNPGTLFREHDPAVAMIDFEARAMKYFDWKDGALVAGAVLPLG